MSVTPAGQQVTPPSQARSSPNVPASIGMICALLSLVGWTVLGIYIFVRISSFPERVWAAEMEDLNSLQKFIHLIYALVVGGLVGIIGVIFNGFISFIALLSNCIGLAFPPRRRAVIGLLLTLFSFIPPLLVIAAFIFGIVSLGNAH